MGRFHLTRNKGVYFVKRWEKPIPENITELELLNHMTCGDIHPNSLGDYIHLLQQKRSWLVDQFVALCAQRKNSLKLFETIFRSVEPHELSIVSNYHHHLNTITIVNHHHYHDHHDQNNSAPWWRR